MPGDRFSKKEDRQAEHIAESEEKRGYSKEKAEQIGYATVNKQKQQGKDHKKKSKDKK
jgi:hypothetical protein